MDPDIMKMFLIKETRRPSAHFLVSTRPDRWRRWREVMWSESDRYWMHYSRRAPVLVPLPHPAVSALFTITLLFLPSPMLSTTSLRLLFISSLSRLPAEPRASCSLARVNRIRLSVNTHVCVCWSVCGRLYSIIKIWWARSRSLTVLLGFIQTVTSRDLNFHVSDSFGGGNQTQAFVYEII